MREHTVFIEVGHFVYNNGMSLWKKIAADIKASASTEELIWLNDNFIWWCFVFPDRHTSVAQIAQALLVLDESDATHFLLRFPKWREYVIADPKELCRDFDTILRSLG